MTSGVDVSLVAEIPLFDGLTQPEQLRVAACLHRRQFAGGASVITADTPGEAVYFILAGTVKITVSQPDGSEVVIAMLGPGEIVGELSVIDSAGRSADVVTQEETTLLWMDRASFDAMVDSSHRLTHNLLRALSRRVRMSTEQIQALCALDVLGKVARQLYVFATQYGVDSATGVTIPMRLTQSDIAGLVGASRERVNQAMGSLRKRDFVSVDAAYRVTVRDPAQLRELVMQR